jgi:hypothetical protein
LQCLVPGCLSQRGAVFPVIPGQGVFLMDAYRTPFLGLRRPHVGQGGGIPFPSLTPCLAAAERQPSGGSPALPGTLGRTFGLTGARTAQQTPLSKLGLSEEVCDPNSLQNSGEKSHISPVMTVHPPLVSPLSVRPATVYQAQSTAAVRPSAPALTLGSPLWPSILSPSTFQAALGRGSPALESSSTHAGDLPGRSSSLRRPPASSAAEAHNSAAGSLQRSRSSMLRTGNRNEAGKHPGSLLRMPGSESRAGVTWGGDYEPSGALPSGAAPRFPQASAPQAGSDRSTDGGGDSSSSRGWSGGRGLRTGASGPFEGAAGRDGTLGASGSEEGLEDWQELQMPAPPTQTYGIWKLPSHERSGMIDLAWRYWDFHILCTPDGAGGCCLPLFMSLRKPESLLEGL